MVYLCRDRRESVCLGKWCYRSSWDEPPRGGSLSSLAVCITARKSTTKGIAKNTKISTSTLSFELGMSYCDVKSYTTFIFITVIISLVNNTKNGDSDYLRFCGVAMICILEARLSLPGGRLAQQAYRGRTY